MKKCVLGCAALLFACTALVFACAAPTVLHTVVRISRTRPEPVDMYDLMLDGSVFPQGWRTCIGPTPPPEHARPECDEQEFLFVGFRPEGFEGLRQGIDGAEHDVFRYADDLDAAVAFYLTFSKREFSNQYMITPWAVPEEWSYESPVADRFRFACAEFEPFDLGRVLTKCRAVAQYDEYISVFGTTVSPQYMTLQDLEQILRAIDERMALYLEKDTQ